MTTTTAKITITTTTTITKTSKATITTEKFMKKKCIRQGSNPLNPD